MDLVQFPAARASRGAQPGLVRVESGGALPAPVDFAPVVERAVSFLYDGSTAINNILTTPDGGITYPVLAGAARLPRVVTTFADYQTVARVELMVDTLLAANPPMEIFMYRIVTSRTTNLFTYTYEGLTFHAKVGALYGGKDWYMRTAAGAQIKDYPGTLALNFSNNVGVDGSGRKLNEWCADYFNSVDIQNSIHTKIAGWFCDNTLAWPRTTCDWTQAGVGIAHQNTAATQYARDGHYAFIERQRANQPTYKFIGNSEGGNAPLHTEFYTAPLLNYLEGGMFEHAMGQYSFGHMNLEGWTSTFDRYKTLTNYLTADKLMILHGRGSSTTDYQRARLVVCTTLLGDGICYLDFGTSALSGVPFYPDEYDVDLGVPLDSAPVAATSGNLWARRYQNGIVVVNGATNGAYGSKTAGTAETYYPTAGAYKKFSGTQQPAVNDGATVGAGGISINGWDGRILLCVTPGVHA